MDTDEEVGRLKWLLIGGIAFIISGCFSYQEMKYTTGGREVDAVVTGVKDIEERGRRGRVREKRLVEYTFKDNSGAERREKDKVDRDFPAQPGRKVSVEYLSDRSRLKGNDNMFWVYVFLASLAFVVFKIFMIW